MSTTNSHATRREAIRMTLARHAGNAPDSRSVVEATLSIWHQVTAQLAPVIGARGVDVLFGRSLHLTSATFPWLSFALDDESSAAPLERFQSRLDTLETTAVEEASYALMVKFTELLAALIGDPLTDRLLGPVWLPPPPVPEQETTP